MKNAILILTLFSASLLANEETPMAEVDFVKETYEYCAELQADQNVDKKELLKCINEELKSYDYRSFNTLEEVLNYIKSDNN